MVLSIDMKSKGLLTGLLLRDNRYIELLMLNLTCTGNRGGINFGYTPLLFLAVPLTFSAILFNSHIVNSIYTFKIRKVRLNSKQGF